MNFESLIKDNKGQIVTYSKAGGGAGGILLITFANDNSIWIWTYWEIWEKGVLLATVNDDITAVTGPVAKAAHALENLTVLEVYLDKSNLILTFSQDYVLKVFSEYDDESDVANWEYWIPSKNKAFTITSHFKVVISPCHIEIISLSNAMSFSSIIPLLFISSIRYSS